MEGIQNKVGAAIGKNMLQSQVSDAMSNFNMSGPAPGPQSAQSSIDWSDYNYPPGLNIVHYDPSELPSEVTAVTRLQHLAFVGTFIVSTLNVVDTFIILGVTHIPKGGLHVLYAFLNFFLLSALAFYIFYKGYCSIATQDTAGIAWYKILQGVFAVLAFVLGFLPNGGFVLFSNVNGFGTLMLQSVDVHGYFSFAVVMESFLWFSVSALGILAIWQLSRTDIYQTSGMN